MTRERQDIRHGTPLMRDPPAARCAPQPVSVSYRPSSCHISRRVELKYLYRGYVIYLTVQPVGDALQMQAGCGFHANVRAVQAPVRSSFRRSKTNRLPVPRGVLRSPMRLCKMLAGACLEESRQRCFPRVQRSSPTGRRHLATLRREAGCRRLLSRICVGGEREIRVHANSASVQTPVRSSVHSPWAGRA